VGINNGQVVDGDYVVTEPCDQGNGAQVRFVSFTVVPQLLTILISLT
jgi:hypothetical protein